MTALPSCIYRGGCMRAERCTDYCRAHEAKAAPQVCPHGYDPRYVTCKRCEDPAFDAAKQPEATIHTLSIGGEVIPSNERLIQIRARHNVRKEAWWCMGRRERQDAADDMHRDIAYMLELLEAKPFETEAPHCAGCVPTMRVQHEPACPVHPETTAEPELHRIRELIRAASAPPVEWGCVRGKTAEEHVSDFRDSFGADTAVTSDLHGVYLAGTETVVCHTGNGPHSEANARLITFALNNLGVMVDEIETRRRAAGMVPAENGPGVMAQSAQKARAPLGDEDLPNDTSWDRS